METAKPARPPIKFDLFRAAILNKKKIFYAFCVFYAILSLYWLYAGYEIIVNDDSLGAYYDWAVLAGKAAIVFFVITILPGLLKRFGIMAKPLSIIMLFRRQLGISVFLLTMLHFSIIRLFSILDGRMGALIQHQYELYGFISLCLLFPLFITSNDLSQKTLGVWWYRLHWAVYIIVWGMFLHVALQGARDVYFYLIAITAGLEVISLIYGYIKNRPKEIKT